MTTSLNRFSHYLLLLLLVVTPLLRGSVQPWAVTAIHIATTTGLTMVLIQYAWNSEWRWIRTPLDRPIACIVVYAGLSTALSVHRATSLRALLLLINYIMIYYWVVHVTRSRRRLERMMRLFVLSSAFLSVFGLAKAFGLNPFSCWNYTDIPQSSLSLTSTFGNRNHMAGYLEMTLPLALCMAVYAASHFRRFILLYIACIQAGALTLTLSRGGWIGFSGSLVLIATMLPFLSRRSHRKTWTLSVVTALAALTVIILSSTPAVERLLTLGNGSQTPGMTVRIYIWQSVLHMIQDHPFLGTGPGTFALIFTQYQPPGLVQQFFMAHNDYLHLIAETGLPAALLMVWTLWVLFRTGAARLKHPSRRIRSWTLGAMAGITAILIHSICDFNLHIPANALLFMVLGAVVCGPVPDSFHVQLSEKNTIGFRNHGNISPLQMFPATPDERCFPDADDCQPANRISHVSHRSKRL